MNINQYTIKWKEKNKYKEEPMRTSIVEADSEEDAIKMLHHVNGNGKKIDIVEINRR